MSPEWEGVAFARAEGKTTKWNEATNTHIKRGEMQTKKGIKTDKTLIYMQFCVSVYGRATMHTTVAILYIYVFIIFGSPINVFIHSLDANKIPITIKIKMIRA